jgi:sulfopropanediol 3-dehydrogenase
MTREYLKKAKLTSASDASDVHAIVKGILDDIEAGGDAKALEYAAQVRQVRGQHGPYRGRDRGRLAQVPDKLKRDIEFAHANVKRFAEAQKATVARFRAGGRARALSPGRRRSRWTPRAATCRAGATATSPRPS